MRLVLRFAGKLSLLSSYKCKVNLWFTWQSMASYATKAESCFMVDSTSDTPVISLPAKHSRKATRVGFTHFLMLN